jgi:hypothetical protein
MTSEPPKTIFIPYKIDAHPQIADSPETVRATA